MAQAEVKRIVEVPPGPHRAQAGGKKENDVLPERQMAQAEDLQQTMSWEEDDEDHPDLLTAKGGKQDPEAHQVPLAEEKTPPPVEPQSDDAL